MVSVAVLRIFLRAVFTVMLRYCTSKTAYTYARTVGYTRYLNWVTCSWGYMTRGDEKSLASAVHKLTFTIGLRLPGITALDFVLTEFWAEFWNCESTTRRSGECAERAKLRGSVVIAAYVTCCCSTALQTYLHKEVKWKQNGSAALSDVSLCFYYHGNKK